MVMEPAALMEMVTYGIHQMRAFRLRVDLWYAKGSFPSQLLGYLTSS
jgi:hypothetical protein